MKQITYHDPCQLGRKRRVFEEPREIIQTLAKNFVDMTPTGSTTGAAVEAEVLLR
jgi:Fe-S oxidoreductase